MKDTSMKLHVIVASHNRSSTTIQSFHSLFAASKEADVNMTVTLFDDGSTDGTADSISRIFPDVHVIRGDGSSFWAQSMHQAEQHVLRTFGSEPTSDDDYILWLNDDVVLDDDALVRALETARSHSGSIIACAMRDADGLRTTYSGFNRPGLHPLRLALVEPLNTAQPIDTFNGNLVLVPFGVARKLGAIDGGYAHALADIDYGYRARQAGIAVTLAPGTYGACPRNPASSEQSIRRSWASFTGVKGGGHPQSLLKILRLGTPRLWPFFIAVTYFLWWLRALARSVRLK